ncbi:MAG: IalB family protein [Gammaproteobacteria bacterium]|nr:MAG: IalB family protein [Gammaproteobacteria bacterium]
MQTLKTLSVAAILSLAATIPNAYALKDGQKFKDWTGQCETVEGKKFCGISQTVFDKEKKPLVNIFIRKVEGQADPLAFVKVPLGVNLLAGLGLAVDKKEIAQVPYTVCDPAGCNAIIPLKSDLLSKIKKGKKLQVGMLYNGKEIVLSASLSGVSKALKAL